MDIRELPPRAFDRAVTHLASHRPDSTDPRDSAAVLLLRDSSSSLEVCTILRHHTMATSAGVLVFPGGLVDRQDLDGAARWIAGDLSWWAKTLQLDDVMARAVVTAAVRELFEETGVLLAGATRGDVAAQPSDGWREVRAGLEAHELTFAGFLADQGWGIRADLLRLWSTWLTPPFESRRYRARFLVASLPPGHSAHDGSTESSEIRWDSPTHLLEGARSGRHQLLAPQYCLALQLEQHQSAEAVATAANQFPRPLVAPGLETIDGKPRLLLPSDLVSLAGLT